MNWLRSQPLFVVLLAFTACLMFIPMFYAGRLEQWLFARTFLYHGLFLLIISALLAIAFAARPITINPASQLLDILVCFIFLPAFLALPFDYLIPAIGMFDAYFEMLSSLTTTGATLFDDPDALPNILHLWRAVVGWFGGYLMLVIALSVLQPLQLGGFEVYARKYTITDINMQMRPADLRLRVYVYAQKILPIYVFITLILALGLTLAGERLLVAGIHAMATISTSGISNIGGIENGLSGIWGELFIASILLCAMSRFFLYSDNGLKNLLQLHKDKEVNLLLICMVVIPFFLFLRHFTFVYETSFDFDLSSVFSVLWGGVFMVLSFLSTTGFESFHWETVQNWSGLKTSGIILMCLAVMGGGIATTAGGIKLLRVYALYKHSVREIDRLCFPNSVGGTISKMGVFSREGAYAAWTFFMLFLMSLVALMLGFSTQNIDFDDSLLLAVSGLSTTGPLLQIGGEHALSYAQLTVFAKIIYCVAMILGRIETLVVISILNPNFWQK